MSTATAAKETLPLTPDQKQVVGSVAKATQKAAILLLAIGVLLVVGGPLAWLWLDTGLLSALLMIAQGVLTAFLGLVMLAVSSDFHFLGLLPQYSGNHLRNVAKHLTVFYQVQAVVALLIGLAAVIRLVGRFG